MTAEKLNAIANAAREWLEDRVICSETEKALARAILQLFPEDALTKENCDCRDREECDECPSQAALDAMLAPRPAPPAASEDRT